MLKSDISNLSVREKIAFFNQLDKHNFGKSSSVPHPKNSGIAETLFNEVKSNFSYTKKNPSDICEPNIIIHKRDLPRITVKYQIEKYESATIKKYHNGVKYNAPVKYSKTMAGSSQSSMKVISPIKLEGISPRIWSQINKFQPPLIVSKMDAAQSPNSNLSNMKVDVKITNTKPNQSRMTPIQTRINTFESQIIDKNFQQQLNLPFVEKFRTCNY